VNRQGESPTNFMASVGNVRDLRKFVDAHAR
jgi:hypothetical protein